MKILSRYVFREILTSSFLATALATFVIFLKGIGDLFGLLVHSAKGLAVVELFALSLPPILLLSVPFGVLVGILVGLGRLSTDNEIIAMRSAGVSSRIVVAPVLTFAFAAMIFSGACAIWLNPLALRAELKIANAAAASQLTANVEPRVFEEKFTNDNTVLYVDDVKTETGSVADWYRVFIADLTPPAERKTGMKEAQPGPRVTVAREALAVPDVKNNRIQLTLRDYGFHEAPYHSIAAHFIHRARAAARPGSKPPSRLRTCAHQGARSIHSQDSGKRRRTEPHDSRIELHRRFALPVACLMLAMVGIPLGTSSRKGGRSAGYIWAIFLAFFGYYLSYITLTGLARSHSMGVELASWLPNAAFGLAGIVMIARMELAGDRDFLGNVRQTIAGWFSSLSRAASFSRRKSGGMKFAVFQILDSYVLSNFLFYFFLTLACFVTMIQVFTVLRPAERYRQETTYRCPHVVRYHLALYPGADLRYTLPIAVLVSILATFFGVMTKVNEVTAFKACGISVRRLGLPWVLLMSGVLSAARFAFDYSYIPQANQIQDAYLNEIKGRVAQTYLHPDRKWIIHDYRIFYVKYFDPSEKVMVEPYVFELDPKSFHVLREISASRARWQQNINAWDLETGRGKRSLRRG